MVPGVLRAGLVFRVGFADETLVNHGVTHLVEHLALVGLGQQPYKYGGRVEGLRTVFISEGTDAEVAAFLQHVVSTLTNLPLDQLEKEAGILRAEAAGRKLTPSAIALADRFGVRGWGLAAAEEFGLVSPNAEDLRDWCQRHFTAGNAIAFVTGSLPDDFRLELHNGSRVPVPLAEPLPYKMPAWAHHKLGGVGVSLICPTAFETALLARIAQKRAIDRLRYVEGISYEISTSLERLDSDHSHLLVWADGLAEKLGSVRTALLEVLDRLAEEGVTEDELAAERESLRRSLEDPDLALYELHMAASDELAGKPRPALANRVAELDQLSGSSLGKQLLESMDSALMLIPDNVTVLDGRFAPLPQWSTEQVEGREYRLLLPKDDTRFRFNRLVVGEAGVTRFFGPGQVVTIRFDRCAAANTWNDGSWTLIGLDGWRLHLRPQDWKDGAEVAAALERQVPANLRVAMGDRPVPDTGSMIYGPPQGTLRTKIFSFRRDSLWLAIFLVVAVRLWFTIDSHPFTSGVNSTASLLSGLLWLFGIAVTIAAFYFLYWRYLLRRRGRR